MAGLPLSAPKEIRARWYLQVEKYNKTIKEVCIIFGMSAKTYHNWYNYERYHDGKGMNLMTPYQKYQQFLLKSVTLECS